MNNSSSVTSFARHQRRSSPSHAGADHHPGDEKPRRHGDSVSRDGREKEEHSEDGKRPDGEVPLRVAAVQLQDGSLLGGEEEGGELVVVVGVGAVVLDGVEAVEAGVVAGVLQDKVEVLGIGVNASFSAPTGH